MNFGAVGAVGGKNMAPVAGHKCCTKRLVEWRCRIWVSMVYVKILFRTPLKILQQHRCVRAGQKQVVVCGAPICTDGICSINNMHHSLQAFVVTSPIDVSAASSIVNHHYSTPSNCPLLLPYCFLPPFPS